MNGYVYLVGAGPGDPNLLTLRGAECLRSSDVVLYDGLVNPALLEHAGIARLICVGKHGQQRVWSQEEIIAEMLRLAGEGHVVSRLKGGDPAVFARVAEEATALAGAKIPFEIVPGITAALAAGSYAGISITHRDHASAVALVTGHQRDHDANDLDWSALAKFPGTLVIYMGVTTVETWSDALIANGKQPNTPVAIVRRCSWPDQQVFRCRLDEVADRLMGKKKIRPPVIVIVGEVANPSQSLAWLEPRPLLGKRILVTRPLGSADDLGANLQKLGAEVLHQPAIEIAAPQDWSDVDASIASIAAFDWVIFSSRNGVRYFLNRVQELGHDMRALGSCKIAAVGSKTAEALRDFSLSADVIPTDFRAESLAETLAASADGKRFLSIRASRGRDVLRERVAAAGGDVREVTAYQNIDVTVAENKIAGMMAAGEIDCVTVTSSAIAHSLVRMFDDGLRQTDLASISPVTSETIRELGFEPACEAEPHTMAGLVNAIADKTSQ